MSELLGKAERDVELKKMIAQKTRELRRDIAWSYQHMMGWPLPTTEKEMDEIEAMWFPKNERPNAEVMGCPHNEQEQER